MSFREPNGVVMTVNMKLLGWKRRIAASSLRGRFATNQNGQAAKEKKQNVVAGAGCSENSSGFQLREKCFSLDIPFYRTSGLPVIRAGRDGAPLLRPAWGQMRLFFL
jgi:hypothetical protein